MATCVGVWLDHKRAIIVRITDERKQIKRVACAADGSASQKGSPRVEQEYSPNDFVAEDKLQRKSVNRLNKYYDEIIASIRGADSILILGPGEAKIEFKKRTEGQKVRGRIEELETADKMTDQQIVANVSRHFGLR